VTLPRIPGTCVEIAAPAPRAHPAHAIFDFDGTISLLRDGWQDHMVPLMVEVLESCPRHECREELERIVIDFVDHLTGKQTIYQMIRLCEEVSLRGGEPRPPLEYKEAYNDRLRAALHARHEGLRSGALDPDDHLLPGSRQILEDLRRRGVRCYLASGTDEEFVKTECDLLRVTQYFDGGIFGALANYKDFSKEKVIRRILDDNRLHGPELLAIGDGYVEIENARRVGAVAFGVYSRENNRYHMNADKRERLLRAGAHFLAPDLTESRAVLDHLEG
jgi:phosphoglycolate phosphatase-like HAD superfamily hydrolase